MKFLRSKRGLAVLAALLLLLFLFRPGAYRLRNRISWSIGSALGRRVTVDNVHIHVLPRPGFDLEGLIIYDESEFGSEPMVRAPDVSAAIRLRSLLRGRLEIAALSATEPSINLVRNQQGRWNLASLIERSAHVQTAPTAAPVSARRPSFPYLEATHARINLKLQQEKKSWALTDADVALWQDSENAWSARLAAQPMRTDVNLSDTGLVRVNTHWQRASVSTDTPLQVEVEWRKGQLGQITKLFSGRDRGWRGGVSFTAQLSGTPKALRIHSELQVDDFRRYDIMSGGSVRLVTACSGEYSTSERALKNISCESPVGSGFIRLNGSVGPIASATSYDLTLAAERVPLSSVVELLHQAKKGLPDDLVATGRMDGTFHAVSPNSERPQWKGKGALSGVWLSANGGKDQITAAEIPLLLTNADGKLPGKTRLAPKRAEREPAEAHLSIGPFPVMTGNGAPVTLAGWLSANEYRFLVNGETEIRSLYRAADTVGVPGFRPVAEGFAKVDLSLSGFWRGFAAPVLLGTAQLRNVRTGMRGLNPPIQIATTTLRLDPDRASLQQISAQVGDTKWAGSVSAPRNCESQSCVFHFDLTADQISSAGLAEWFTRQPARRQWYRLLSSNEPAGKSPLLAIQGEGKLRINRFVFQNADASQITAHLELNRGRVIFSDLRGRIFQGMYQGRFVMDASAQPPRYQAVGALQSVSLAQVSAAMHDGWATGTADGKFDLATSGASFSDLLAHPDGEITFVLQNGAFAHLELPDAPKPFPVHSFAGRAHVKNGIWNLAGRIESHDGIYQLSGTASTGSGLNFVLTRGDEQSWNVTGTLRKPRLTPAARTEARSVIK